jgi:translation elongation factor EF-1alpha
MAKDNLDQLKAVKVAQAASQPAHPASELKAPFTIIPHPGICKSGYVQYQDKHGNYKCTLLSKLEKKFEHHLARQQQRADRRHERDVAKISKLMEMKKEFEAKSK